jgi:hypothetical protein
MQALTTLPASVKKEAEADLTKRPHMLEKNVANPNKLPGRRAIEIQT